jgi:Protein O-mannosyl-transferase TMEM260-like
MEQSHLIPDITTKPAIIKRVVTVWVFVLTIIFYIYTLLPSLAWGDGTKLQSEAISGESFVLAEMNASQFSPDPFIFAKVGVAAWDHPLYIIMGHILVQAFPHVDSLWLVNLISAIFGAASVALVFLLCYQLTGSLLASGYAGFSLAVSHTFWWHSSTPEVYTLFTFLLLMSIYLFDQFERTDRRALLLGSAFFFGLAASDHILAFLAIPALVLYYFLSKVFRPIRLIKGRDLVYLSLVFLAGFSIYLIQFFRMFRNFNLNGLMGPVVGSTFISRLGTLSPILLGMSLLSFLFLLIVQFNPIGVILGGLGIQQLIPGKDLYSRKIIALCIVYTLFGIFYRVSDQFSFFLTSYVFWAILMGIGANRIFSTLNGKLRSILISILILMILGTPFFYAALPGIAEKKRFERCYNGHSKDWDRCSGWSGLLYKSK